MFSAIFLPSYCELIVRAFSCQPSALGFFFYNPAHVFSDARFTVSKLKADS
jgi:hypothetical protein